MGYVGVGTNTESPGVVIAKARWDMPSFEPIVAIASEFGSKLTSKLRLYQSHIANLSL